MISTVWSKVKLVIWYISTKVAKKLGGVIRLKVYTFKLTAIFSSLLLLSSSLLPSLVLIFPSPLLFCHFFQVLQSTLKMTDIRMHTRKKPPSLSNYRLVPKKDTPRRVRTSCCFNFFSAELTFTSALWISAVSCTYTQNMRDPAEIN